MVRIVIYNIFGGRETAENTRTKGFAANWLGDDGATNAPTIRLANLLLERAITERSSDIHVEPHEKQLQVRKRIDGVMRDILNVPSELQSSVISRIKIMSGMDIAERRIPQDGRFNVKLKDKDIWTRPAASARSRSA